MMKVTDYVAQFLVAQGITTVFGYQGSSVAHIVDSMANNRNIKFIETRHEQGAAFSAVGYAKTRKSLGVAVACSGPGALNLINGIADAYYDSVPTVFITGQVSQKEMKGNLPIRQLGFQETDVISVVSSLTKYAETVSKADDIPYVLQNATKYAISGRPGPVLIDIPHNVQGAYIKAQPTYRIEENSSKKKDSGEIDSIAEKLLHAKRPVIILGGGCVLSIEKQDLLADTGIPIAVSYLGRSSYCSNWENYTGVVGVYGNRYANWAVKYSDYLLCLGTRLDGRQTAGERLQLQNDENVSVVDIDETELSKLPACYDKICANAVDILDILVERLRKHRAPVNNWLNTIIHWKEKYPIISEYPLVDGVNPLLLLHRLSNYLLNEAVITLDVGQNQIWANVALNIGEGHKLIQSGGLGAMGFSLPAAIGASFAKQQAQIISISGDGGFQMNVQELQTIQENAIPIKVIVFNNHSLGLIRDYQNKALGGRLPGSVIGFGSPDYKNLAMAYGMTYMRIADNDEVDMLKDALSIEGAVLIEIEISKSSVAAPESTYGKSILYQSPELSAEEYNEIEEQVRKI